MGIFYNFQMIEWKQFIRKSKLKPSKESFIRSTVYLEVFIFMESEFVF